MSCLVVVLVIPGSDTPKCAHCLPSADTQKHQCQLQTCKHDTNTTIGFYRSQRHIIGTNKTMRKI